MADSTLYALFAKAVLHPIDVADNPIFTIRKKANEESKFVIDMTFTVNRDTGSG